MQEVSLGSDTNETGAVQWDQNNKRLKNINCRAYINNCVHVKQHHLCVRCIPPIERGVQGLTPLAAGGWEAMVVVVQAWIGRLAVVPAQVLAVVPAQVLAVAARPSRPLWVGGRPRVREQCCWWSQRLQRSLQTTIAAGNGATQGQSVLR